MTAIDFPDNPADGDTFTAPGGVTWVFNDPVWNLLPAAPPSAGGSDGFTFIQDTEPSPTAAGQTWFDTSTGDSFVWVVDVDSSQWVQFAPGAAGAAVPRVGGIFAASAPQAIAAGTFATITFDQVVSNNGIVVTNNNTFTVPETGEYAITLTGAPGAPALLNVLFAGVTFIWSTPTDVATGWATVSGVTRLTAGQAISCRVWAQPAGNLQQPRLEIWKLNTGPVQDDGAAARGLVAYARVEAAQGGITAVADLNGLTGTWVADPTRRYRATFEGQAVSAAASMVTFSLTDAANAVAVSRSWFLASGGVSSQYVGLSAVLPAGLSGPQTFKMRASNAPGGSTLQLSASPTVPAEFYIEDIGAAL